MKKIIAFFIISALLVFLFGCGEESGGNGGIGGIGGSGGGGGSSDRAVEIGDTVNIDFIGTMDGTVFTQGTENYPHLEIGSGRFPPGFEDQLIGMKVGETREVEVSFPETYERTQFAGQPVMFAVTLNSIN